MSEQENKNVAEKPTSSESFSHAENLLDDFGAAKPKQAPAPEAPRAPLQKPAAPREEEKKPAVQKEAAKKAPAKKSDAKKAEAKKDAPEKRAAKAQSTNAKVKNKSEKEKDLSNRVQASTATPHKEKPKKDKEKEKKALPAPFADRSAKLGHRILPYVLMILGVFIGVCLISNLFCNLDNKLESTPADHMIGVVGYYVCYVFFGLFGPAAFLFPVLTVLLGVYWKKYIESGVATAKILVSVSLILLFGALIHVFGLQYLISSEEQTLEALNLDAGQLMSSGAQCRGGGVLGGKLGYFLFTYLNVAGSAILCILLMIISLFYVLGMTPQRVWLMLSENASKKAEARAKARIAERAAERSVQRKTSLSEEEAEDAHLQAKMDEKIRKITAKQSTPAEGGDGVEVLRPAPQKKAEEDKLAPMPMPRLDPTDGTRPFVPGDIGRKMNAESRAAAQAAKASAPATPAPPAAPATPNAPVAPNPAKNRDTAVDPIFPKSNEARAVRKIPKQDRNFDLNKVFLDLDDNEQPPAPKHAPIPPEVPLRPTAARPTAKPAQSAPAAAQAPEARATTPATRPAADAPAMQKPTAIKKPSSAEVAAKKPIAPSLSSMKPAAQGEQKPVFRQAKKEQEEFGLSNEQFEALEAKQGTGSTAKSPAKATAAKTAEKKSDAAKREPAKATAAEKAVKAQPPKKYVFPPISYLQPGEPMTAENRAEIEDNMTQLSETLASFHVRVQEINYSCGPTVTRYEVVLAPGVRVRSVTNLADDIALALRSPGGVRIEAPIPGTNAVGIEIPNKTRSTIYLRDMIESKKFAESKSPLSACLGADIAGTPLIFDIAKMPHLLVAGTTGSGKSVCINCIITSLLYKVRPDEVKLILIDPKKVEFSIYKNIPHLMAPVVTLPKDAAGALQAAVEEMERRFEVFESVGVRDLKGYNTVTANDPDMPFIPHIVIIIDELADLMMTARNEVETAICRIAQKARAAGMHLIIGTQRPSADVVTGLIKANVPSSIAFAVKSQIDSRVILDHGGAEALTGRGDMLFVPIGSMRDTRVQGAFVDDKEVERICEFLRATNGTAVYDEHFTAKLKELAAQCGNKGKSAEDIVPMDGEERGDDPKYADAVRVAVEEGRISTSLLQRKLGVGYSRAAKLIDRMQAEDIVSPPDGSKPRAILITPEQYLEKFVDNVEENADSAPNA